MKPYFDEKKSMIVRIVSILSFLVVSVISFGQPAVSVIGVESVPKVSLLANSSQHNNGTMPNSIKIAPLLRHKLYNNGNGHDVYQLSDGMVCLVPDKSIHLKLLNAPLKTIPLNGKWKFDFKDGNREWRDKEEP